MSAMPAQWRKSTRSNDNGQCVEVACTSSLRLVRDSKNPVGPVLTFGADDLAGFLSAVKAGRLDD